MPVVQPTIETSSDANVTAGDLLIAMGVDPASPEAIELVETAGTAGAAAVAFRMARSVEVPTLVRAAEAAGVGLVRLPVELGWDQLYSALESAVTGAMLGNAEGDGNRLRPGDLNALANAVSAMAGGPVTIEDPDSRVLAHSSGSEPLDEARRASILERRTPEDWRRRFEAAGVYRRLWTSDEVVRITEFASEGLRPRLAVAVRVGDELLGSIWVAEGAAPLGPASETALAEAARIAGVHLARRRSTADVERRVRSDLLRSLLDGRGAADITAARLGMPAAGPFAVLAFRVTGPGTQDHPMARDRVVGLVGLRLEAWSAGSASVAVGDTIYALVPLDPADGERSIHQLVEVAGELVERAKSSLGTTLRGGSASPVDSLDKVPQARAEAAAALDAVARSGRSFCTADEVRAAIILDSIRGKLETPLNTTGLLEEIRAHDAGAGTEYLTTLRAHLDSFGDVTSAAARLAVHPNTFRYRIRRLGELFGLDIEDSDERLAIELELTLWPTPSSVGD